RGVLLAAEDVALPRTAAGREPLEGELDRERRVELHEVGDPVVLDAEQAADGRPGQGSGLPHVIVGLPVGEDDVEGDPVGAGVLAPDRLGQLAQGGVLVHGGGLLEEGRLRPGAAGSWTPPRRGAGRTATWGRPRGRCGSSSSGRRWWR